MKTRGQVRRRLRAVVTVFGAAGFVWACASRQVPFTVEAGFPPASEFNWYKGNTHAHTLNSDGDSTPDEVVRWYRERDYHFLVLTDHNYVTSVDGLNALHGADERFLVIKGEEVTDSFDKTPIHVNGLNVGTTVDPQGGATVLETLQRNVDAVREVSGVPHINHPNFQWAITAEELQRVQNARLFEVYNGHPKVNNIGQGAGGPLGLEQMWDRVLSSGKLLYGIAVDDAHVFKRPWDRNAARPGHGWVMVRAQRLAVEDLMFALEQGHFYASTGVEVIDYQVSEDRMTVVVSEEGDSKYRVEFIGGGGTVLREVIENPAVYEFQGNEGYVRARVIESNGRMAWLQPVIVP